MDGKNGVFGIRGGGFSNLNVIKTAFNMGNFTFVHKDSVDLRLEPRWYWEHEYGHTLNLALFGSVFHLVGFIHEMGLGAGRYALAEQLAESRVTNSFGPHFNFWLQQDY